MPSIEHEAVVQLILNNPRMLEALLATGGVIVPSDEHPLIADSNLSVREPDEFHAELVTVHTVMGRKLAIVVEVQTDPPKPVKRRDWPAYLTVAGRRHACDAVLVVIALRPETARASRKLIRTGHPDFGLIPIVVAFDNSPLSGGKGPDPELLLMAVLTGRLDLSDHETQMLILSVLRALKQTDLANFESYTRLIRYLAPSDAQNALGELMKITFPRDDLIDGWIEVGLEQGIAQGEAMGEARILLRVLTARGLEIPDDIRDTVLTCTDTNQLEAWADLAATAPSIDEIFKR
jgi:hypothetical protein